MWTATWYGYKSGEHDLIGEKSRTKICGFAGKKHYILVPILFLLEVVIVAGVLNGIPPIVGPYIRKEAAHLEGSVIAAGIFVIGVGMQFMLHYTGFLDYEKPEPESQPHCRCKDHKNMVDIDGKDTWDGTWRRDETHAALYFCVDCSESMCHGTYDTYGCLFLPIGPRFN